MINYDLSYSEIKAQQKNRNEVSARIEKAGNYLDIKIMAFAAVVFVLFIIGSNMAFNDCLKLGVC